jgi:hypothetical protein
MTFLGGESNAPATCNNTTVIGYQSVATESNQIMIGTNTITSIVIPALINGILTAGASGNIIASSNITPTTITDSAGSTGILGQSLTIGTTGILWTGPSWLYYQGVSGIALSTSPATILYTDGAVTGNMNLGSTGVWTNPSDGTFKITLYFNIFDTTGAGTNCVFTLFDQNSASIITTTQYSNVVGPSYFVEWILTLSIGAYTIQYNQDSAIVGQYLARLTIIQL